MSTNAAMVMAGVAAFLAVAVVVSIGATIAIIAH